jgi:Uncharacterized alpha/beta hydrolase domain (DUF2235)
MANALLATHKQIIICCDGTNNTLTGNVHDTNVLKLYQHLSKQQRDDQVLYYDPGVGAPDALPAMTVMDWVRNKFNRLWSLASGRGIYENIGQAYAFLMKHYQPGDQIYLYGFSRGAFTVRCLSGMVHLFGVLNAQHESLLPTILRVYFSDTGEPLFFRATAFCKRMFGLQSPEAMRTRQMVADQIRETFCDRQRKTAAVHFIGVWDTVASVGFPGMGPKISSTSTIKNKRIVHVRHAVALDEHRLAYQPRLYLQNNFGDENSQQSLLQMWFPGNHSDIGGGYPQHAGTEATRAYQSETLLSDRALDWMHRQAQACGLHSSDLKLNFNQKVVIHDATYSIPWWALLGLCQRKTQIENVLDESSEFAQPMHIVVAPRNDLGSFNQDSVWRQHRDGLPLMAAVLGIIGFSILCALLLNYGDFAPGSIAKAGMTFLSDIASLQRDQIMAAWDPAALLKDGAYHYPIWALWIAELGLIISVGFLFSRWLSYGIAQRLSYTLPKQNDKIAKAMGNALLIWLLLELIENTVLTVMWGLQWPVLGIVVSIVSIIKCLALLWLLLSCLLVLLVPRAEPELEW